MEVIISLVQICTLVGLTELGNMEKLLDATEHRGVCNLAVWVQVNSLCLSWNSNVIAFNDVISSCGENLFKVPENIKFYFPLIFIVAAFLENSIHTKTVQKVLWVSMKNRVMLQGQILPAFWFDGIFESFVEWRTVSCVALSWWLQNL